MFSIVLSLKPNYMRLFSYKIKIIMGKRQEQKIGKQLLH